MESSSVCSRYDGDAHSYVHARKHTSHFLVRVASLVWLLTSSPPLIPVLYCPHEYKRPCVFLKLEYPAPLTMNSVTHR
jgi:hypothetical protein